MDGKTVKGFSMMKILVVDDMMTMRHVITHMLRDLGYTSIDEACDGMQALQMINKKVYDLVITDFYMPNLDGQQLLKKIRSQKETQDLPVLMVSCVDNKEKIKAIIACKVTGFIVKPFCSNTLKNKLNRIKSTFTRPAEIVLG